MNQPMRRTAIAAAWIAGTTLPLLASAVMLFGCCVLPFHRVLHRVMPLCHTAIGVLHGAREAPEPQAPAREKQEPAKRIATAAPRPTRVAQQPSTTRAWIVATKAAYRSVVTHGALRCDQDVGLHLLVATLLI